MPLQFPYHTPSGSEFYISNVIYDLLVLHLDDILIFSNFRKGHFNRSDWYWRDKRQICFTFIKRDANFPKQKVEFHGLIEEKCESESTGQKLKSKNVELTGKPY